MVTETSLRLCVRAPRIRMGDGEEGEGGFRMRRRLPELKRTDAVWYQSERISLYRGAASRTSRNRLEGIAHGVSVHGALGRRRGSGDENFGHVTGTRGAGDVSRV